MKLCKTREHTECWLVEYTTPEISPVWYQCYEALSENEAVAEAERHFSYNPQETVRVVQLQRDVVFKRKL